MILASSSAGATWKPSVQRVRIDPKVGVWGRRTVLDKFLHAISDEEVALGIGVADITSAVPAVDKGVLVEIGALPVSSENIGTLHPELTSLKAH